LPISLERAKNYIEGKHGTTKEAVDIIREINELPYSYNSTAFLVGDYLEIKRYDDPITVNLTRGDAQEDRAYHPESREQASGPSTSSEDLPTEKLYEIRSNKRRRKKLKGLIKINADTLSTYLVLTLGNKDYKVFLQNVFNRLDCPPPAFSINEAKNKLAGVKKLDKCDKDDVERLDPEDDKLRKQVIDFLKQPEVTDKERKAKEIVYEKWGEKKEPRRFNEEVKREVPRQLDELICNGNPYDIESAQRLFDLFRRRINRHLEESDQYEINKMEYIKVVEQTKDGRVHYNLLCNLPYIKQWKLQKIWDNGIVHVKKISHMSSEDLPESSEVSFSSSDTLNKKLNQIYKYLVKEMSIFDEDEDEEEEGASKGNLIINDFKNKQLYSFSEGIRKPFKITSTAIVDFIMQFINENNYKHVWDKNIESNSEYGHNYRLFIYDLDSVTLYERIDAELKNLLSRMITLAESKGQNIITQEEFNAAIKEHKLPLEKDYFGL